MKTNESGLQLIKRFEGLRLNAYQDVVNVWTIGYGHTGSDVTPSQIITEAEADQLLAQDLMRFEKGIEELVMHPVNANQFAALVCFSYNLGLGNLKGSTLLKLLNTGDHEGAAGQFPLWNKAGGKVLRGLTERRLAEQALYKTPVE